MRIFRAGTEDAAIVARDKMRGSAVTETRQLGTVSPGRNIWVPVPKSRAGSITSGSSRETASALRRSSCGLGGSGKTGSPRSCRP